MPPYVWQILSPKEYKKSTGLNYRGGFTGGSGSQWSSSSVKRILTNEVYLGHLLQGRTEKVNYKVKKSIEKPKEEWVRVENTHEPIISDSDFEAVQNLLKADGRVSPESKSLSPFMGLLFCGDCGEQMVRRRVRYKEPLVTPEIFALASAYRPEQSTKRKREKHPLTGKIYCGGCGYSINYKPQSSNGKMPNHFWCRKHSLLQIPDCCTYFRADILEEIVLTELYRELMRRGDLIKQRGSLEQFQKEEWNRLNKELGNYRTQYQSLQTEKDTLYESYAVKQIGAGEYRSRADGIALQMQELSCKIEETELAFGRLTEEYNQPKQDMKEIIRFSQMEKLTQEAVDVFIKKVIIYRDKRVEIEWNYAFGEE